MPEFGNAFSGLAAGRNLTHEELVRAVRMMVAAEYEAVQLYVQLAESTDHELAKRVLMDIADEEIVHAGEFLTLLKELAPREESLYEEGAMEVREMAGYLSGGSTESEIGKTASSPGELTVGGVKAEEIATADIAPIDANDGHDRNLTVGTLVDEK